MPAKTPLMLPEEQTPDWYTMSSKPVFVTSIPMILQWVKNTKSTKTLLIDYLWEEQAIKWKRIKLTTYEPTLASKFSFITWKSPGWMMTFPNSSDQFQLPFSVLELLHQYPLQCWHTSDSLALLTSESIEDT